LEKKMESLYAWRQRVKLLWHDCTKYATIWR
jgi:hypothetical protein